MLQKLSDPATQLLQSSPLSSMLSNFPRNKKNPPLSDRGFSSHVRLPEASCDENTEWWLTKNDDK